MDSAAAALYERARSGTVGSITQGVPAIGPEGSARWRAHSEPAPELPTTLILSDLALDTLPPLAFGPEAANVVHLDLAGNNLTSLPPSFTAHLGTHLVSLFLDGGGTLRTLPPLNTLRKLEELTLHDTRVAVLPLLPPSLKRLRLDRTDIRDIPAGALPVAMETLHLEGSPIAGTYTKPQLLPAGVTMLAGWVDLQLPDGMHVGSFFGNALPELLLLSKQASALKLAVEAPVRRFIETKFTSKAAYDVWAASDVWQQVADCVAGSPVAEEEEAEVEQEEEEEEEEKGEAAAAVDAAGGSDQPSGGRTNDVDDGSTGLKGVCPYPKPKMQPAAPSCTVSDQACTPVQQGPLVLVPHHHHRHRHHRRRHPQYATSMYLAR